MNFCVLIELSKKKISFLYNRSDGVNVFTPFEGEGALPLAIYCLGNDIQIGKYAIEEAQNQSPYAFTDVFKIMKTVGTYKYRGNEYHYNTLLKNAIEKYISLFFDKTLIGQMGRLEQNIKTMPLCFIFNADVDENERLFVKDCFEKSGYGNLGSIDYDKIVVEASAFTTNYAMCVTSDGNDLFTSLYETKTHKYLGSSFMCHEGKDPRINVAVDKLWDSLGYDNYYLEKTKELPVLTQIAEAFLSSGQFVYQDRVLFSDGNYRDLFLSIKDMENYKYSEDSKIITELKNILSKLDISPLDCTVVLKGKAANNGYFKHIFNVEFNSIINVDDTFHNNVLSQLLKDIKAENYVFNKASKHTSTPQKPYDDSAVKPDIESHQRIKELVKNAKFLLRSYRNRTDLSNVKQEMEDIINGLKEYGYRDNILQELEAALASIKRPIMPTPTPLQSPKDLIKKANILLRSYEKRADLQNVLTELEAVIKELETYSNVEILPNLNNAADDVRKKLANRVDPSKYKRDVKMLERSAPRMNHNDAIKKIDELLSKMHADGVHDFDSDINSLRNSLKVIPEQTHNANSARKDSNAASRPSGNPRIETPTRPQPPSQGELNKFKRDVRMALHKTGITKKELQDLLNKAHQYGVHDFDKDLNAVIDRAK